jgi:asparagine synthase (glutamine-hydrolysing)
MCGISGIMSQAKVDPTVGREMTHSLGHRGPDAENIFYNEYGNLILGHTRLSVIDLSDSANQPMHSADGKLTIVFNGEIYNYQSLRKELVNLNLDIVFRTNSDTETILFAFAQWGPAMVSRLEGMFAMAIYDHSSNALFLFRDRLGKKPLFYSETPELFVFASEIKSLLKHPVVAAQKVVNMNALHKFLHLGYIPQPDTIFSGIRKFPSGSWAKKKSESRLEIREYWSAKSALKHPSTILNRDSAATKLELKSRLHASVEKRLISDVPVGTFLSGGTDSSLVTAIASQHHKGQLKTFTIGFKESKYDETNYAEQVARHLRTDHHTLELGENDAIDLVETYLHHFDEPFADTSAIPTMLVSKLARKEVTVALTGDGGDELFMGYGSYDWARRLKNPLVKTFQYPASNFLKVFGNDRLKRIGKMLERVESDRIPSHIFSQEQYFFSDRELRLLLAKPENYSSFSYSWNASVDLTPAEQQAIFDLDFYLKDDLLVKVDRASMYYSLECRCPLLDIQVVKIALQLSEKYKIQRGEHKWILKELLKEYLPDNLIFRPKWGFSVPLPKWLNGKLGYLIDDYLNDAVIENFGIVRKEVVKELIGKFKLGEQHLYNRLWVLIVLHKWLKENG